MHVVFSFVTKLKIPLALELVKFLTHIWQSFVKMGFILV